MRYSCLLSVPSAEWALSKVSEYRASLPPQRWVDDAGCDADQFAEWLLAAYPEVAIVRCAEIHLGSYGRWEPHLEVDE